MKRFATLLLALVIAVPALLAQDAPVKIWTDENTFPIMSWGPMDFVGEHAADPEIYSGMKECGITIAGFATNDLQVQRAKDAGLKVFYGSFNSAIGRYDWRNPNVEVWRQEYASIVEKYKDEDAVMGYYVKDEPSYAELPGVFEVGTMFKEMAPNKVAYLNLYSNSTQPYHYEPDTYEQYVERVFASDFPMTGFDQYNFYQDGYIRTTMHSCLEIYRKLSLKYNKPWWYCALSNQHRFYAKPNVTTLAYQAFSGLAYGAKGISWFLYLPSNSPGWVNSPIDNFLHRSPVWYDLQLVNLTVQNYAHVLNHLRSDRVYHFGSTVPSTDERVPGPDENSLISGMANSGNWLVGEFTHDVDGSRWLIIVNKNLQAAVECTPIWRKQPTSVACHSRGDRGMIPFNRKPNDSNIIEAGWGVLLKVDF